MEEGLSMAEKKAKRTSDVRGTGDELHQGVVGEQRMTTAHGNPIGDNQNSLRAGDRGPTLVEDFHFRVVVTAAEAHPHACPIMNIMSSCGTEGARAPRRVAPGVRRGRRRRGHGFDPRVDPGPTCDANRPMKRRS